MDLETVNSCLEQIKTAVADDAVTRVVLVGMPGMGKTWAAREAVEVATTIGFDFAFRLSLRRLRDRVAPQRSIAEQLHLSLRTEEWDDDGDEDENYVEQEKQAEKMFRQQISKIIRGKKCLLVLDDISDEMTIDPILSEFESLLQAKEQNQPKLLTVRREDDGINDVGQRVIRMEPLSKEDSVSLLQQGVMGEGFNPLFDDIATQSMGIVSDLLNIIEALNYIGKYSSIDLQLENALEKLKEDASNIIPQFLGVALKRLQTDDLIDCFWYSWCYFRSNGPIHFSHLISLWIMEGCLSYINGIERAYHEGFRILLQLIDVGLLKEDESEANSVVSVASIKKAAEHRLKDAEDYIMHERFHKRSFCHGFGTVDGWLASVHTVTDRDWEDVGEIRPIDGMIRTLRCGVTSKISTLLVDGNRLNEVAAHKSLMDMSDLQVLGMFNWTLASLPVHLTSKHRLRVLILRDCDFLLEILHIGELTSLVVLEISGAKSLEALPDSLFDRLAHLKSLNLSRLQVRFFPKSISSLTELQQFVARNCSCLERLPDLGSFSSKLKVLDVSGCTSLTRLGVKNSDFSEFSALHTLDFSDTRINRFPQFKSSSGSSFLPITRLSLSNCRQLTRLPSLNTLQNLQVLDLAGSDNISEVSDDFLECNSRIKILDLSQTDISVLPANISNPSHLSLRDCPNLKEVTCLPNLKNLELLDLSGCFMLSRIGDSFEHLRFLHHLDVSETKIQILPSLTGLGNLQSLLLRDCESLVGFENMEGLVSLEVLDLKGACSLKNLGDDDLNHGNLRELILSGCASLEILTRLDDVEKLERLDLSGCMALSYIQNDSFAHMSCLHTADFSETKLKCLPTLPNKVARLLLRNCNNLERLPDPVYLSTLEELDVSGAISLKRLNADFLEDLTRIQILKLSGVTVELPRMSTFAELSQVFLSDCPSLEIIPDLESLTKLEVLDLSETGIKSIPSLKSFRQLRKLLLRDCLDLEALIDLESLSRLEVLDLWGSGIKEFPYGISELTCLKCLRLPILKGDTEIDWDRIKHLPEDVNWDECGIFTASGRTTDNPNPQIVAIGTSFFECLGRNPILLQTCFKHFCFSIYLPATRGDSEDGILHADDGMSSEIKYSGFPKRQGRFLEIIGSFVPQNLSSGLKEVLRHAEYVSLSENKTLRCFSEIGSENVRGLKGCWLDRCSKMEKITDSRETGSELCKRLETLWVSNLVRLVSVDSWDLRTDSFKRLRRLCVECCPELRFVFCSSPLLESLEILEIKFCDKLERLLRSEETSPTVMPKLRTLILFELPVLRSIGFALPPNATVKSTECPKLDLSSLPAVSPLESASR